MKFFPKKSTKKKVVKRNPQFEAMRKKRMINNYSKKVSVVRLDSLFIKKIAVVIVFLVLILVGSNFFLRNEYYSIKNIEVFGNNRISTEDLRDYLDKYKNENLLSLQKNVVFKDLRTEFLEIGNVNLVKVYPDLLKVEIVETLPAIVYFDLDSIELISVEGLVVGHIGISALQLSEEERTIAENGGDPDAEYVRNRLQGRSEGAFKWDEVLPEERLEALREIASEVELKITDYVNSVSLIIQETSFKDLTLVYKKTFGEETLSQNIVSFILSMGDTVKSKGLGISRVNILNIYDLSYELDDNKTLVFTIRRDVSRQIRDLNAIILNNQFSSGRVFDLRSSNYSIR